MLLWPSLQGIKLYLYWITLLSQTADHTPTTTTGLIFAGRVLKPGKTLGHYKVVDGCTLHLLRKEITKKGVQTGEGKGIRV